MTDMAAHLTDLSKIRLHRAIPRALTLVLKQGELTGWGGSWLNVYPFSGRMRGSSCLGLIQ